MLTVVHEEVQAQQHVPAGVGGSLLDELVRDGARQMLAAALQAEVAASIEAHADQLDTDGRRLVVRNGSHAARQVATAAGVVPVQQPRVNDKRIDEATEQRIRPGDSCQDARLGCQVLLGDPSAVVSPHALLHPPESRRLGCGGNRRGFVDGLLCCAHR